MIAEPKSFTNDNQWDGKQWLLTPEEVDSLPIGTRVVSISGKVGYKGIDKLDKDTRFGYTAWGIYEYQFNEKG